MLTEWRLSLFTCVWGSLIGEGSGGGWEKRVFSLCWEEEEEVEAVEFAVTAIFEAVDGRMDDSIGEDKGGFTFDEELFSFWKVEIEVELSADGNEAFPWFAKLYEDELRRGNDEGTLSSAGEADEDVSWCLCCKDASFDFKKIIKIMR